jgi:small subunit ribosomal protein S25e
MAGGSKKGKKKWSKGRVREKAQNQVLFDQPSYDRMLAEVPKMKLISPSVLVERFKVNGALARAAIKHLAAKNLIKGLVVSSAQGVYTRATAA